VDDLDRGSRALGRTNARHCFSDISKLSTFQTFQPFQSFNRRAPFRMSLRKLTRELRPSEIPETRERKVSDWSKESNPAWPLRARDITLLLHYYGPLRHPAAFGPFPVSAVIGPTCSKDFSMGHTGLLQFPSSPCYRVAANTPPM
jgi:hypothetical protein